MTKVNLFRLPGKLYKVPNSLIFPLHLARSLIRLPDVHNRKHDAATTVFLSGIVT